MKTQIKYYIFLFFSAAVSYSADSCGHLNRLFEDHAPAWQISLHLDDAAEVYVAAEA